MNFLNTEQKNAEELQQRGNTNNFAMMVEMRYPLVTICKCDGLGVWCC